MNGGTRDEMNRERHAEELDEFLGVARLAAASCSTPDDL